RTHREKPKGHPKRRCLAARQIREPGPRPPGLVRSGSDQPRPAGRARGLSDMREHTLMANEPQTPAKRPPRILSGVQPSGKLHLGNYYGAVKQHIALQDEGPCFFFIANYHALTTVREAAKKLSDETNRPVKAADLLRQFTLDVALDYLALGLDPSKVAFFRQSDVPEVADLTGILSPATNMGLLERAASSKDKIDKGIEPSVGLFTYPVLMAADILIYRSNIVPVGQDQVQHLEMTQDMAGKFNRAFGEIFPIPNYRLTKESKVPGTDGQ